jgi:hypothetical protein
MPLGQQPYDGDYHASPECWSVYGEVLAAEFGNAVLFGRVHQLTVDSYAAQHAGGRHRDKSVCIHLVGLCLVLEHGLAPTAVPPRLQRLAAGTASWPHFTPPEERGPLTVLDVALAESAEEHVARVRAWAEQMWRAFRPWRGAVEELAARCLEAG